MMDKTYIETVRLLLAVAPTIFREPDFAMKGGTAINLFVRDMPRLSVDIDVVYSDHRAGRAEALKTISSGLEAARSRLIAMGYPCEVATGAGGDEIKVFIRRDRLRLKVEVNHVFRGTVLPVKMRSMSKMAQDTFKADLTAPVLHPSELYGSKLVAAMDRQHPRDIFDVLGLYAEEGLTPEIVECFVCYLAGHNRPVHEVLFARPIDIRPAFESEFVGMSREPLTFDELLAVREKLFADLPLALTNNHRLFLLGLVSGEPDWSLMSCPHLSEMPAIRWKLENLTKLKKSNPHKFAKQYGELRARFGA
jgi:predicted nucleotidyltransferase component of viral defense system